MSDTLEVFFFFAFLWIIIGLTGTQYVLTATTIDGRPVRVEATYNWKSDCTAARNALAAIPRSVVKYECIEVK